MSIASLRTHTDAVLAALVAAMSSTTVGDAVAPSGGGWAGTPGQSVFTPYMILYPLTQSFDGPIGDNAYDDAELTYQVTCVGETRMQAEWLFDKAVAALVGEALTITGRATTQLVLSDVAGGARRDDTVQPPVFIATPRFTLSSVPS